MADSSIEPTLTTEPDRRAVPRTDPIRTAHHDAIYTLARASEIHDTDTGYHVLRIRCVVECLALKLGFAPSDAEALGYDAMLHDVGKLMIPRPILRKPQSLNETERRIMESHTVRGEELLSERPSMQRAASIARHHHECYDGSGYPDGLAGDAVPIAARITAAADVLDALISTRVYKQSWTYEQAMREVIGLAGSKLDPDVVRALQDCNADGSLCEIYGITGRCVV